MRSWPGLAIALGLLSLIGCGEQAARREAAPGPGTAVARGAAGQMPRPGPEAQPANRPDRTPERYVLSVQRALELKDEADTKALQDAIGRYRMEHGHYPERLEALPEVRDRGMDTSRWFYDRAAGKVALTSTDQAEEARRQVGQATEAADSPVEAVRRALQMKDMSDWKAMKVAINVYRTEEGRFPERLEDLPILRERAIDPSRWVYEPATGKVYLHPSYR